MASANRYQSKIILSCSCLFFPSNPAKYFETSAQTLSSSFNIFRQLQLTFLHNAFACASSNLLKYRKSWLSVICFLQVLLFFVIRILPSSSASSLTWISFLVAYTYTASAWGRQASQFSRQPLQHCQMFKQKRWWCGGGVHVRNDKKCDLLEQLCQWPI